MKKLLVILSLVAAPLFAQPSYNNAHLVTVYSSLSDATTAIGAADADVQARTTLTPVRTFNTIGSWWGPAESMSWVTIIPSNSSTEAAALPGAGVAAPVTWSGTVMCGSGLRSWTVESESTMADALTFVGTLSAGLQRNSASIIPAVGSEPFSDKRYLVVYRVISSYCF